MILSGESFEGPDGRPDMQHPLMKPPLLPISEASPPPINMSPNMSIASPEASKISVKTENEPVENGSRDVDITTPMHIKFLNRFSAQQNIPISSSIGNMIMNDRFVRSPENHFKAEKNTNERYTDNCRPFNDSFGGNFDAYNNDKQQHYENTKHLYAEIRQPNADLDPYREGDKRSNENADQYGESRCQYDEDREFHGSDRDDLKFNEESQSSLHNDENSSKSTGFYFNPVLCWSSLIIF